MKHKRGGYTIIEVLIVIATTSLMLTFATHFLRGQTTETTFQTTMRDIQSKIESSISAVGNSLFPNSDKYTCTLEAPVGGDGVKRAKLSDSGTTGNKGTNEDCLYLGKAIGVAKGTGTLYIYNVLGGRTYDSGGKTLTATTYAQTNPIPALELNETYSSPAGNAKLVWARYDGSNSTEMDLGGFYNDLVGSNAERQRLLTKVYPVSLGASGPDAVDITTCIEEKTCTPAQAIHWTLCYEDLAQKRNAKLDIAPSDDGIVTKLDYTSCS